MFQLIETLQNEYGGNYGWLRHTIIAPDLLSAKWVVEELGMWGFVGVFDSSFEESTDDVFNQYLEGTTFDYDTILTQSDWKQLDGERAQGY